MAASGAAMRRIAAFGGGNTPAMLAVWREFGFHEALHEALREALDQATVLAGISAGANCWFERYITDSGSGGGLRAGLGRLPGVFCPHLDSEPWRQPLLAAQLTPEVGAGDGVLVLYVDDAWVEAVPTFAGTLLLQRIEAGGTGPVGVEPHRLH